MLDDALHDLVVGLATSYVMVGLIFALTVVALLNALGYLRIPPAARPAFLGFFGLAVVAFGSAFGLGMLKSPRQAAVEVVAQAESDAASSARTRNVVKADDDIATGSITGGVVYIQVPDMDRRFEAEKVWKALRGSGFRSPGIELVSGGSPARPEVRYFNDRDRPIAERVAAIAAKQGVPGAIIRTVSSYKAPLGQIEFWYPR